MLIPPPPPKLEDYRAGTTLVAGLGVTTIVPDIDFETYSPAGFVWNEKEQKFKKPIGATKKGIFAVGAAKYSEHPDAEVICLAYDLKDGCGRKLWTPDLPSPLVLLEHVHAGGIIEAWNVAFEYWIWTNVCVPTYGFPPLDIKQLRCAAAKSRAHALPGSLAPAGMVVGIKNQKDKDGTRLINKFSIPRNPTKHNASLRTLPSDDPEDAKNFYNYCLRDIQAEAELSSLIPDLSPEELHFWQCDLAINIRGVQVDVDLIEKCKLILEQAYHKYDLELFRITDRTVGAASELPALKEWLAYRGYPMPSLTAETLGEALSNRMLPPDVRRALELREMLGSQSVKKPYSMSNYTTKDGRLHDLFMYHAARTGRASGNGPQPQNLPNSGPDVSKCENKECGKHFNKDAEVCPWCNVGSTNKAIEWNPSAVADAIEILSIGSLPLTEYYFGDAVEIISACLRGMFIAAPGKDLICSDYSAIEAVVLAALAGEQWRLDVFNTHGKIYEMSAAKINGMDFEEFELYKSTSGSHHPARKLGKLAELASGYQGAAGAWTAFGGAEYFPTKEGMQSAIDAWRAASPNIVKFWYGVQDAALAAVRNEGIEHSYNGITYICKRNVLYCRLLSGRLITYHRPIISTGKWGKDALSFEGWNTNPKYGATGWVRMDTYGGKLTENIVQATARDILAHAIVNLEAAGYPVVLHVHDEIIVEVPEGWGSVTEVETIMSSMPHWAKGWPVKAKGGWRAKRYNK